MTSETKPQKTTIPNGANSTGHARAAFRGKPTYASAIARRVPIVSAAS